MATGNLSLSGSPWLQVGFDLLRQLAPPNYWSGDYVCCAFDAVELNSVVPQSYHNFLDTIPELSRKVIRERESGCDDKKRSEVEELSRGFTTGSQCFGTHQSTIQLQAPWKVPKQGTEVQARQDLSHHSWSRIWREDDVEDGHLPNDSDLSDDQPEGVRQSPQRGGLAEEQQEENVQGELSGPEAIESSGALSDSVPFSAVPAKVRLIDGQYLVCDTGASFAVMRSRGARVHLVGQLLEKLVWNRLPLQMCAVLGSAAMFVISVACYSSTNP